METPRLIETKKGWMALGEGWGLEAPTKEEALKKFSEAEIRHCEIEGRAHWFYERNAKPSLA